MGVAVLKARPRGDVAPGDCVSQFYERELNVIRTRAALVSRPKALCNLPKGSDISPNKSQNMLDFTKGSPI
jgi:hypothetical protein